MWWQGLENTGKIAEHKQKQQKERTKPGTN
jgi:hypothetical protein